MNSTVSLDQLELEAKPIGIGGRRLEIFSVKNIDPIMAELEQKPEGALEAFPFWVKIWEASIVLADHLVGLKLDTRDSVLEVGAGMGVTGLFLGAFGHPATLTDYNADALALLKKNAAHNQLDNVQVKKLDWTDPDVSEQFDIICGSELIYKESDVAPLLHVLQRLIKPGGTIYLAHDIRRMSMITFLAEAGKHFDISHKGKSFTGKDQKIQVVVHTLKPLDR